MLSLGKVMRTGNTLLHNRALAGLDPACNSAEVAEAVLVINAEPRGPAQSRAERPQMLLIQATKLVAASVDAAFALTLVLAVPEGSMAAPSVVVILPGVKDDGPGGATILIAAHAAGLALVAVTPVEPFRPHLLTVRLRGIGLHVGTGGRQHLRRLLGVAASPTGMRGWGRGWRCSACACAASEERLS